MLVTFFMSYLDGSGGSAVDLSYERVTDDDVAVDGEGEDEQLTEVLRQEVQHVEHLHHPDHI